MLRRATPQDHDLIAAMWLAPDNAKWIEPPEAGDIDAAIAQSLAFLWDVEGKSLGFTVLIAWVPQVFGLSALVSTKSGQGEPMLRAVLAEVFGPLNGHRIGFDVTVDNDRAIRLYERVGFQREGLLRECWKRPQGDWVDCYLMGLLAREYHAPQRCL